MKKCCVLLSMAVSLAFGCAHPAAFVKNGSDLQSDKVYLVGKVTLTPELKQDFSLSMGGGSMTRMSYILIDSDAKKMLSDDVETIAQLGSIKEAELVIPAEWGKSFIVELPRKKTYMKGLYISLVFSGNIQSGLLIRMNAPLEITEKDDYIYVGDFNFVLNKKDQYMLTVGDNFKDAQSQYSGWVKSAVMKKKLMKQPEEVETIPATVKTVFKQY